MSPERRDLPALAVLLAADSFSPFQISEAAHGLCDVVFVIDPVDEGLGWSPRMVRRMGRVVSAGPGDTERLVSELGAHHVAGIVTYTDTRLVETAEVAARLGVPFHTPEVAAALTDKDRQRRVLRAAGVPGPASVLVEAGARDRADLDGVGLPAVVKPRRGSASRDAVRVDTVAELEAALAANADQDVVVETFLADRTPHEGREAADFVSVETVADRGRHRVLGVTGRFPTVAPLRETGSYLPSDLGATDRESVIEVALHAAAALGVTYGFLHTEIKLTPDGPGVIEVNGRIGGGIPQMLARIGGPSLLRWSLLAALGRALPEESEVRDGVGFFLWVQPPVEASAVVDVGGLDALREVEGITDVRVNRGPGDSVDWRRGGLQHVLAIEGRAPDHARLRALRHRVLDALDIRYL